MRFGKLVGFVLFVALLYILWKIRQVLLLAFTAVAFATVLNHLVRRLQKLGIPRGAAVGLTVVGVLGILAAAIAFIAPSLVSKIPESASLSEQGLIRIQEWYGQFQGMIPGQVLQGVSTQDLWQRLREANSNWTGGFFKVFSGSVNFVLDLLLVIVVTIMLLSNPMAYRRVFLLAFPKFYRSRADDILTDCENALVGWAIGIGFNMVVITLLSGLGLWFLGVPLPIVNAILAGLLTFIPNVGPFLSVIPPTLMALTVSPWRAIAVVILYIVIQQVESNLLTPLVMKRQVSLLPAITLLSQVIFAAFFGLLGLFLALPLVVVLQVWAKALLVEDILNTWPQPRWAKIADSVQGPGH
ncbi:AI-2E family transporter [Romeria aff. gracilis LEGE 07310]|uniref:AI-2E family transporter n=1 Tax=Vasconcelosia minhoensis LEGE 07310 TaxID=915328 RepID=A0A8J7AEU3_9CYAN|nr:AI-2E family transporter [Romeria gracilis]MBE9076123.1 AI-2E family transporter [Romeria aff. gracilis LEGE 07310]